jgi:hypothetical protein
MLRRLIVLFVLLAGCQDEQLVQKDEPVIKKQRVDLVESQIELVGEANRIASEWEAYQDFLISLENTNLISSPNLKLSENITLMSEELPDPFDSPAIRARILALETHVKKFESFLGHTQKNDSVGKLRYSSVIISLDNLKLQLMEKLERDKVQDEIDEFMRQQFKDSTLLPFGVPGTNTDSIAPKFDKYTIAKPVRQLDTAKL